MTTLRQFVTTKYLRGFSNREELEAWQETQVQDLLKTVLPRSPFYTGWFMGHPLREWRSVPMINKQIMMDNFDSLNTVGIRKKSAFAVALKAEKERDFSPKLKDITVGLSSGTSGNRGLFIASDYERACWAGAIMAKVLPTPLWRRQKIAFFMRANSNLYTTINHGTIKLSFFDMWKPLDFHLSRLNEYQPTIVVAPPSILRLLAEETTKGSLSIAPLKIISVAETLEPLDEMRIKAAFQQTIHQIYQCTEGFLAATCSEGTLHLNEDIVVIQKDYVDRESGRFCPVITDFSRISQPIIRYRLDDILVEKKESCACGSCFTALAFIEGRTDDIFYGFSKNEELIPVFPDFIRRAIISVHDEIQEYFVIQNNPTDITVSLRVPDITRKEAEGKVDQAIADVFVQHGLVRPHINFDLVATTTSGKLRRIERRFMPWT